MLAFQICAFFCTCIHFHKRRAFDLFLHVSILGVSLNLRENVMVMGLIKLYLCVFFLVFSFNRKANLILHRVEKISHYCRSLLRSTHIQSRTDTMAYVYCRSEEGRPPSNTWHGSLHERRANCMEKLISVQRNTYSNTKLRWDRSGALPPHRPPPAKWHQWLTYLVTHSAAGVSQVTGGFWKPGEPKKPQNSLDIVLKLPKNIFLCGLLLL